MAKIDYDAALKGLEIAEKEYERARQLAVSAFEELDFQKDSAASTMIQIEDLASSIGDYPILFKKRVASQLDEVRKEVATYREKEKIIREKRNFDIAAGASTVAALGVGSVLITSFKDFWNSKLKLDNKWGKNIAVWIVVLLLIVVALLIYWIAKATNRIRATKKAAKNTKKILSETSSLKGKTAKAEELSKKLDATRVKIEQSYFELEEFKGMKYKEIPCENREALKAIINATLGLAKLANTRIE